MLATIESSSSASNDLILATFLLFLAALLLFLLFGALVGLGGLAAFVGVFFALLFDFDVGLDADFCFIRMVIVARTYINLIRRLHSSTHSRLPTYLISRRSDYIASR